MFGFLFQLAHPILESLKGTDKEWLVNLMYAFNSGNISKFDDLKKSWGTQVRKGIRMFNPFIPEFLDIFHISAQNIDYGYSLELPPQGSSNKQ